MAVADSRDNITFTSLDSSSRAILSVKNSTKMGQSNGMIIFYSGTPGSGKSLHMAKRIWKKLLYNKQAVIANFPVDTEYMRTYGLLGKGNRTIGDFTYVDNFELSVKYLVDYALKNHVLGKESQTLVCIDECQILFNPREFNKADRLEWITFFTQHRKLGYDFILVSQFDRLVDRQIRCLFEYDVKHRKANNFGFIGMLLPFPLFCAVTYWYSVRERMGFEWFLYSKKYASIYNSYELFSGSIKGADTDIALEADEEEAPEAPLVLHAEVGAGGGPHSAGDTSGDARVTLTTKLKSLWQNMRKK